MAEQKTIRSITGYQFTGSTSQVTIQLTVDGAAYADSISVGDGETLTISDVLVGTQVTPCFWQLQQSDDGGVSWYVIAYFGSRSFYAPDGTPTSKYSFNTGLVVNGSSLTSFRVRATTPEGSGIVHITLRAYTS